MATTESVNANGSRKDLFLLLGGAIAFGLVYIAYTVFKNAKLNRGVAIRLAGKRDLESMRAANRDYATTHGHFLHTPEDSRYSWQASLLPYLGYESLYHQLDMEQAWNTEPNVAIARTVVEEYVTDGLLPDQERGFALSHYAANVRIVNSPTPLNERDVIDGKARTIMAFEVPNEFLPWMNPENVRDPTAGIGNESGQIGREGSYGCQVLFMGGSVQFLSENIDQDVLEAMATYGGNDRDEYLDLDESTQESLDAAQDLLNSNRD